MSSEAGTPVPAQPSQAPATAPQPAQTTVPAQPTETAAVPAAPEAPVQLSPKEVADRIAERARGIRPEPARSIAGEVNTKDPAKQERAAAQLRAPDGKFIEPEGAESPSGETGAADPVPEGMVKIALDAEHELVKTGVFPASGVTVPAEMEKLIRWNANNPIRKAQLDEAIRAADEARRTAAEAEFAAQFWQEHAPKHLNQEFLHKYNDIRETYGEEDAERYRRAVEMEAQNDMEQRRQEAMSQQSETVRRQQALDFREVAIQDATQGIRGQPARFPGWVWEGENGMQQAMMAYGSICDASGRMPSPQEWVNFATRVYEAHPAGQRMAMARRARDVEGEAERLAADREKSLLTEAAQHRRENPLAGFPGGSTGQSMAPERPLTNRERIRQMELRAKGLVAS